MTSTPRIIAHYVFALVIVVMSTAAESKSVEQENVVHPQSPSKNLFGTETKNQTEVFAAKDVNKKVTQAVRETLGAAVQTWGSSGRLEYWI